MLDFVDVNKALTPQILQLSVRNKRYIANHVVMYGTTLTFAIVLELQYGDVLKCDLWETQLEFSCKLLESKIALLDILDVKFICVFECEGDES
jgi:hypothetical protein